MSQQFTVTIDDDAQVSAITWARTQYNLTQPRDEKGQGSNQLETDNDYVQWIMDQATMSYAKQQQLEIIQQKVNTAHTAGLSELKALADSME